MIIAKGKIIVGDKTYTAGETVEGLSRADIKRMSEGDFLEVREDSPAIAKKERKSDNKAKAGGK